MRQLDRCRPWRAKVKQAAFKPERANRVEPAAKIPPPSHMCVPVTCRFSFSHIGHDFLRIKGYRGQKWENPDSPRTAFWFQADILGKWVPFQEQGKKIRSVGAGLHRDGTKAQRGSNTTKWSHRDCWIEYFLIKPVLLMSFHWAS